MKIPKPVRPRSKTINERLNKKDSKFIVEVMRQVIKSKNTMNRDNTLTSKEQVAKIYWEAGEKFKHHGKQYINTFREIFLELCEEDGIKW